MLTHDSIFQLKTPAVDIVVEFESVEPLFKLLGSFFYFWPLTTSRNYQTGGLRDFEFVGMDRFNSTIGFSLLNTFVRQLPRKPWSVCNRGNGN
jgi:hypothetical protein